MLRILLLLSCVMSAAAAEYTLESGDYSIRFAEELRHTVRSIRYRSFEIGTRTGFYGTVMAPEQGKYIGSGHTEGGVEKVLQWNLLADGKAVEPKDNEVLRAQRFVLEKISQFDNALFRVRIELTPEGFLEQKRFITLAEQKFHLLYVNLFCWNKETTDWFARTAQGAFESGSFRQEKVLWHLEKEIRWTAIYDAGAKKGVLLYYPEIIRGSSRKACYWEVPRAYNKFYMMAAFPIRCAKGWQSPVYSVFLRGFEAPDAKACPAVLEKESARIAGMKFPALPLPENSPAGP
ncbi:MAG: hypothetical protein BWY31_00160 [Lentisphaerae bacterium ADurb.Bin242]|nr:MAG: hypothetical protein BWY31_00160 [Lentisphaerae bacterium ADurb.Bin242]